MNDPSVCFKDLLPALNMIDVQIQNEHLSPNGRVTLAVMVLMHVTGTTAGVLQASDSKYNHISDMEMGAIVARIVLQFCQEKPH